MQDLYQRPRSPFDDSALERLRRMGLADADGRAIRDVMTIFARIFAGQFYDDLCDYYQDYSDVRDLLTHLVDAAETAEPKPKFLLICLQYDGMFRDFCLDEYCNIGYMNGIADALNSIRGFNMSCQSVVQSLSQWQEKYPGKEWENQLATFDQTLSDTLFAASWLLWFAF